MARRLVSTVVRMRGGATLGFGARVRIYDDEALTTLATIYRRSTGAGTQPNPILPNAGRQTALTVNAGSGDSTITVASTAGFQVGDIIPIRDVTNFRYRVITNVNVGTGVITLDLTLGVAFLASGTTVGGPEMRGHIWGWLDTVLDPFAEIEDIASSRRSPPLQIPMSLPSSVVSAKEEGGALGQFSVLNYIGTGLTAADAGAGQLNITHGDLSAHGGAITDAQHGARTGPTDAHELADITGLADHSARHDAGGADVMAIDAASATGSLRTLGYGAGKALDGAGLTTAEASLGSPVTMTSAGTYYDGPSVSLAAGTWFITGTISIDPANVAGYVTAKLWDGTTVESSGVQENASASLAPDCSISVSGIVVLGGTTTMKISAANSASGGSILATAAQHGAGANASHIKAIRIA